MGQNLVLRLSTDLYIYISTDGMCFILCWRVEAPFLSHPLAALEDQATPENVMQDLPPQTMEKKVKV